MSKNLLSKLSNLVEFRAMPFLNRKVQDWKESAFSDIGLQKNGKSAPRALMIFPTQPMGYYIQGRLQEGFAVRMQNIYFQGLAMLTQLVDAGFVVDVYEKDRLNFNKNTEQYSLVIDEGNSLAFIPAFPHQTKVFFATGLKWDRWNFNEVQRIQWFYEKYGFYVMPRRQLLPVFSDTAADYILFKGITEEMTDLNPSAKRFQLAMPVDYEPETVSRDLSRREFMWIGSKGSVFKGLDIVVDAFKEMPDMKLHLFGPVNKEQFIFKWLQDQLKNHPNISYHGYADYRSNQFLEIIKNCVAHVYPSAGENGCATLAQTCHFGLIPISTTTANNQASNLGYTIGGATRNELVQQTIDAARTVYSLSDDEVKTKSDELISFAKARFTRDAFIKSFDQFLGFLSNPQMNFSIKTVTPLTVF